MKISTQSYGITTRYGTDEGFKILKEAGFEAVDWPLDLGYDKGLVKKKKWPENFIYDKNIDEIIASYQDEIDCMKKYGLVPTQAHGFFPNYVEDYPELLDKVIEVHKKALKVCEVAGCPRLVIHGGSRGFESKDSENDLREYNMKLYEALIPTIKETGVMVLLENLFVSTGVVKLAGTCCDASEAVWYLDTLNAKAGFEAFGFCLDTGHLNLVRKSMYDYILMLDERIKALHIHDNSYFNDEHLAPYAGTIVWKELYEGLRDIGYTGDLNFETFRQVQIVPEPLVKPYLNVIYECGKYFKEQIEK